MVETASSCDHWLNWAHYQRDRRTDGETNAPILLENGTGDPRGNGKKWSTFGANRSKVKVIQSQS